MIHFIKFTFYSNYNYTHKLLCLDLKVKVHHPGLEMCFTWINQAHLNDPVVR